MRFNEIENNLSGYKTDLEKMIIFEEGFSSKPYRDTEGLLTIGIGFCIDRIEMPEEVARHWLKLKLEEIEYNIKDTEEIYVIFKRLSKNRKMAIINMCYQMGVRGVCGFRKMWEALDKGNYRLAADEALDSGWSKQTPSRAKRVSAVIRSGTLNCYMT